MKNLRLRSQKRSSRRADTCSRQRVCVMTTWCLFIGILIGFQCLKLFHSDGISLYTLLTLAEENEVAKAQSAEMLSCLREVLFDGLPVGKIRKGRKRLREQVREVFGDRDVIFVHHYDARDGKWNAAIRMEPIDALKQKGKDCSVWEIGAHKKASDSVDLLKAYPDCTFHAFEPITPFFNELENNLKEQPQIIPHNYGIASKKSTFTVSRNLLKGQATYIGDSPKAATTDGDQDSNMEAQVESFETAVSAAGNVLPTLVHINCEGCEWEMIPDMVQSGFISKIQVLQVGTHNYGQVGLGARTWQYCEIRNMLNRTHNLVKGVAFGWERWELRTDQDRTASKN